MRENKTPKPELADFHKRAIALMGNKFLHDYRNVKEEEIEHFYEVWAPTHIRELVVREQVWHYVMQKLKDTGRSE